MTTPPIEDMPLSGLRVLRTMHGAGWQPQVAYRSEGGLEYWQLVGCTADVRMDCWWRRAPDLQPQWKGLMMAWARPEDLDPAEFAALEPSRREPGVLIPVHLSVASVLDGFRSAFFADRLRDRVPDRLL